MNVTIALETHRIDVSLDLSRDYEAGDPEPLLAAAVEEALGRLVGRALPGTVVVSRVAVKMHRPAPTLPVTLLAPAREWLWTQPFVHHLTRAEAQAAIESRASALVDELYPGGTEAFVLERVV